MMNVNNVMRIFVGTLASSVVFHRGCQGAGDASVPTSHLLPPPPLRIRSDLFLKFIIASYKSAGREEDHAEYGVDQIYF